MKIIDFLKKSIAGELSLSEQKDFLIKKQSPSAKELADAVKFLLKQMPIKINLPGAIDICGTGGSGLSRINTSTISAFILASLGVKVAKHGNKAASGRFGSFDLLEAMDIPFPSAPKEIEKRYARHNLAFLYARDFHPVMKHFAQVRKEIGKPTFFNLLGPLLSPAHVKSQIIGTAFKDKMHLIAETCRLLGKEKVYVVCGEDGLDEVTLTGKTFITELNNKRIKSYTISPKDFGIKKATFSQIKGSSPAFSIKMTSQILEGKCRTRHADLVLINAALALKLTGKAKSLKQAYSMAKQAEAYSTFQSFRAPSILTEIAESKKLTPSIRDFYAALSYPGLSVIAEIKRRSPSKGNIATKDFSPKKIAQKYEKSGASAISVLCDEKYFGGSLNYMKEAADHTKSTPILCKDFIIHEYQIFEARKYGADAILLIAAILTTDQIKKFTQIAQSLNMDVLCEVHTLEELKRTLKTPIKIIGINNRDLHTFNVDLKTTHTLASHIPKNKLIVSESGLTTPSDIKSLPKNINAVLIGTAFMQNKLSLNSIK